MGSRKRSLDELRDCRKKTRTDLDCPFDTGMGAMVEEADFPYQKLSKLGEGTYGVVYKVLDLRTGQHVALKKVPIDVESDGMPGTTIREIGVLREVQHPNIITMMDVKVVKLRLYVVFELMELDLCDYIREQGRQPLPLATVKSLMWQLVRGVSYLHNHQIIHRDLNLLLDRRSGTLKIADFGLSRRFTQLLVPYTPEVVTLWYRCPELILGDCAYTPGLDLWSLGCILAEMSNGRPLLPGESDIHQLFLTFQLLGTPNETSWPGSSSLPHFQAEFPKWKAKVLSDVIPHLCLHGLDFVTQCLRYEKLLRMTSKEAVAHPFFSDVIPNLPLNSRPEGLMMNGGKNRQNAKTPKTPWEL